MTVLALSSLYELMLGTCVPHVVPGKCCVTKNPAHHHCAPLQAIRELAEGLGVPLPDTFDAQARTQHIHRVMEAVREGRLQMSCCFVKLLPFTTEGDLVPVMLACGCTVSRAGARELIAARKCTLCFATLDADASCDVDGAMLRVVQAQMHDLHVPQMQRCDITLGKALGTGGQGSVYAATLRCGKGEVAVKVVPLPEQLRSQDLVSLRHVVTTTFLASRSPHVCRMLGASWGTTDLWCGCLPHEDVGACCCTYEAACVRLLSTHTRNLWYDHDVLF